MEPNSPPNSIHCNSKESQDFNHENDDESLSLCDLPTSNHEDPLEPFSDQLEEDFDFGGFVGIGGNTFPVNKMSSADELFFRGRILPLQHSISFSGSEPESVGSSRSSSSTRSTLGSEFTGYEPMTRVRNRFHSHPSPTPHIRTGSLRLSNPKRSSRWRFLHLGVMKSQEIGLEDLKNRRQRSNSNKEQNQNNDDNNNRKNKKMEMLLFGGCKCSANVIEDTVCSRIPMVKQTCLKEEKTNLRISKQSNVGRRKHAADAVSSHRTSEWLKQI